MIHVKIFLMLYFIVRTMSYQENISKIAINLSQASYCVNDYVWNCKTCDNDNKLEYIIENNGAKALVGYNNELSNIFVAFRGSENILNWIDNIQVRKINPYDNNKVKVEKGFYKAYQYLKPQLLSKIKILKYKYKTNMVFLTGHSLGAAIATLFSYDILTNNLDYYLNYLITFGSPRVGNKFFVESFKNYKFNSYRITHNDDIVPHLPEEFLNYLHIPSEIWYNETNSNYNLCNDTYYYEDNFCSNSCSPFNCISVNDHLYYMNISLGENGLC